MLQRAKPTPAFARRGGACRRRARRKAEAELAAWLRANRVGRAVMEASGGYERSWAEALRAAGVEVLIVDPKRIRHFAKAAGRLAKNDPIDAETIAWFAETFPDGEAQAARSRARGGRPAGPGPDGLERAGRADRSTGRASPAGHRRQGPGRDRQDDAGRAAQNRRRDRRQDQSQPGLRATGRNHRERAGPRRSSGRRPDRLGARARAHPQ